MKYVKKNEELCTQCHLCEDVCSKAFFKTEDRSKSSIRINDNENDSDWIINVCNQCGECIDVCSEQAIYRNKNGIVMIDKEKCVGCYICVGFCPTLSMRIHKEFIVPFKCVSCGICTKNCPTGAIVMETLTKTEEAAAGHEE